MISAQNIPVQNIYYMLSYAFQVLTQQGYKNIATEPFENVDELYAAILSKGVSAQIKCGLGREYIQKKEPLSSLRGKIEITDSIKSQTLLHQQMICAYDDFSVNAYKNRILKTTMEILLHSDISRVRKKELRKVLVFFSDVDVLDIHSINWNLQYDRNNQTYRMLISVCYLVIKELLQTESDGPARLMDFQDEQPMYRLYEKFILAYFRREFPQLHAAASQIPWALDEETHSLLPVMQSDVTLSYKEKVLIIDAKYYAHTMQTQYNIQTLRSSHLYQMFTYVKNKEASLAETPHTVSGLLLYARTDEPLQPDNSYQMSGNRIDVRTLDLGCNFSEISAQLNGIVKEFFGICKKLS
ncbi:MAG: 5-methylcytosine-specific restriction endonuclease system specificity protein McrC [Oscillospiraceae bacterium]|nr:5-methylcytosine-specific restriction endonuclease system specificity protein McrC [Oscillospiraceae bacterium]